MTLYKNSSVSKGMHMTIHTLAVSSGLGWWKLLKGFMLAVRLSCKILRIGHESRHCRKSEKMVESQA